MRPYNVLWASLLTTGLALPFASPSRANVLIDIDKTTQHMLVSVDGVARYDWPVSTGRRGFDTPAGTFKPNRMETEHFSKEYENAPMPYSIFFDLNGHAIHGFFDTPHLGLAVSHGCVRLAPANAAILFELVKAEGMANTTVEIHGHIPANAPLVARRGAPARPAAGQHPLPIAPDPNGQYAGRDDYAAQVYAPQVYAPQVYAPQVYPPQVYARQVYPGQDQRYGRPVYDRWGGSAFPPQPAPSYGPPAYGQDYDGRGYYARPAYGGYPPY